MTEKSLNLSEKFEITEQENARNKSGTTYARQLGAIEFFITYWSLIKPKWITFLMVFGFIALVFLSIIAYFLGMQLIVYTASEWKNSWLVITGQLVWFFFCLSLAISVLDKTLKKSKMHFTSAS
ncbi:hypothetical protein [Vibrio sp. CyArs1]|uniref:hypothetical protein n=1 Tax=Vibrio sp. CyArs1 TaxID=2682577 RepID=UPI001F055AAD|nr:hypothetical protein [Vibrio sp. CyArs1]